MTRRVFVVGAGLAGLAAAVRLSERPDLRVTLVESSPKAGGRCRSYDDSTLERSIDNGNHLILSGNAAVLDYARRIGAPGALETLPEAAFPFVDLASGARWTIRVPRSPLGMLRRDARPPGAGAVELAQAIGLMAAGPGRTVAEAVRGRGAMWRAFWVPMTTAVLNAPPEHASAALLRAALTRTFLSGAAACRPVLAPRGLGAALVDPAIALLLARGVEIRFRAPLSGIAAEGGRARSLIFDGGAAEALGAEDGIILAVPPAALARLIPDLATPGPGLAILNAHFRVTPAEAERAPRLLGLLGSNAQWVFRRGDVLSVTVSAAEATPVWSMPKHRALSVLWAETARAVGLGDATPIAARAVRERAATFEQSVAGAALRPPLRTRLANVLLAGDHVGDGGLPASLEGAVRSGEAAAARVLERRWPAEA